MLADTLGMTMNMTTNTVALVTGASSGIGRETAQLLAEHDARTFGTVRDLRRASLIDQVELIEMDVNDDGSVREAVRSVLEKAGKIDVLINNAGYSLAGGLEETSVEEASSCLRQISSVSCALLRPFFPRCDGMVAAGS